VIYCRGTGHIGVSHNELPVDVLVRHIYFYLIILLQNH